MKESNQGNPDGIACCRLGRKAEGRKEGPNGEWGKREGGGLQKQRASLALHLHPMSTFLNPELHPGPPPWLPSQRDAETYAHPTPLYPHPCISWDLTSKLNVDLAGPAFLS